MDLKQALIRKGATPQQANSKVVELTEAVLCEKQGVEIDTLRNAVNKLAEEVAAERRSIRSNSYDFTCLKEEVVELDKKVTAYKEGTEREIITDNKLLDTLNFYTAILSRTQAVFGAEKMTEAVIIQLLETASYGIWRSIMGGKYNEESGIPTKAGRRL